MKFRKWLGTIDTNTLAYRLKVTVPCVRTWVRGTSLPKGITMKKLVRLGKGAFDYRDIVLECTRG